MFQSELEAFLVSNVYAFIMTFVRFGTAMIIMPGIGDAFVSSKVRLYIALAISFMLYPLVMPYLPADIPDGFFFLLLVGFEFIIGLFFGIVARIFLLALDVAGMIISMQSGLANAQVFNPGLATQGSIMGAFLTITAGVLLFATDLHHLLIRGLLESYELFSFGDVPNAGGMAELISRAVSASFLIGVKIAMPFMIVTLLLFVGMGVLSRLMPQVQVFMIALPIQILLALIVMSFVVTSVFIFWLSEFENAIVFFLTL